MNNIRTLKDVKKSNRTTSFLEKQQKSFDRYFEGKRKTVPAMYEGIVYGEKNGKMYPIADKMKNAPARQGTKKTGPKRRRKYTKIEQGKIIKRGTRGSSARFPGSAYKLGRTSSPVMNVYTTKSGRKSKMNKKYLVCTSQSVPTKQMTLRQLVRASVVGRKCREDLKQTLLKDLLVISKDLEIKYKGQGKARLCSMINTELLKLA